MLRLCSGIIAGFAFVLQGCVGSAQIPFLGCPKWLDRVGFLDSSSTVKPLFFLCLLSVRSQFDCFFSLASLSLRGGFLGVRSEFVAVFFELRFLKKNKRAARMGSPLFVAFCSLMLFVQLSPLPVQPLLLSLPAARLFRLVLLSL